MKRQIIILLCFLLTPTIMAVTLNTPTSNEYIQGQLNATSVLSNSDLSFYVNNESSFGPDNLVCLYDNSATGDYTCDYLANRNAYPVENLAYHWKLDRPATLTDSVKGAVGVNNGATHLENEGIVDSYSFDGTNDWIEIGPLGAGTWNNGYTISLWVWRDIDVPNDPLMGGDDAGANRMFQLRHLQGTYNFYFGDLTSSGTRCLPVGVPGDSNKWTHIVANYNLTDGYIMVDGVKGGECSTSTYDATDNPGIEFGRNIIASEHWDGKIDDVMIFNRSLTEAEIANLYNYQEGEYYAKVNDTAGTPEESSSVFFYLDLNEPILDYHGPRYESGLGHISFEAEDTNSFANVSANITLDGTQIDYIDFDETINYINTTTLSKGRHNISILITDLSGRITLREKIFDVMTIQKIKVFAEDKTFVFRFFANSKNAIIKFFGGSQ